jgi:cobyrinic acid a,c-diamide synthase
MPRTGRRRHVDRSRWHQFRAVAENFANTAEVAAEFEYWNAAGVLLVHAGIAFTDAVTVKIGGVKSAGEDHALAADLLEAVVAVDAEGKKAVGHFRTLVEEKTLVSYSGEIYRRDDVRRMARHLDRYRTWANRLLAA